MRLRWSLTVALMATALSCARTKPGTHVELVDQDGAPTYVAGAAGPGVNKSLACGSAVQRAVAAIALKFAQEQDDIGDDVAEALGASDGEPFLQRFAKAEALAGAVQDVQFDPVGHLCMATVRWKPPLFIKEAVLKYATKLKEEQMQDSGAPPAGASASAPPAPSASMAAPAPASVAPPAPASVAPPAPAQGPPKPAAPLCKGERRKLAKALDSGQKALNDHQECSRRTEGDDTICHRYKLYVEEAQKKERAAGERLCECLNRGLSTTQRQALSKSLRGHAAVAVENRGDGTLILWTFSPVDKTAFALEVSPSGEPAGRTPLAANQVQWVRQQLGL